MTETNDNQMSNQAESGNQNGLRLQSREMLLTLGFFDQWRRGIQKVTSGEGALRYAFCLLTGRNVVRIAYLDGGALRALRPPPSPPPRYVTDGLHQTPPRPQ